MPRVAVLMLAISFFRKNKKKRDPFKHLLVGTMLLVSVVGLDSAYVRAGLAETSAVYSSCR